MAGNLEYTESQYKPLLAYLDNLPQASKKQIKLLEIGAGSRILKKFLPANIIYHSLDYTGEQTYLFNLDCGRFPINDKSYDIIVCLETLEHTMYPKKVLKEINRIARCNCVFFLSMPNEYNLYLRFLYLLGKKNWAEEKEPFRVVENHHHIQKPRVKDILGLFKEYFEIEEISYFWYSNLAKKKNYLRFIDNLFQSLAKVMPSLFTRLVVIRARKLEKEEI